MTPRERIFMWFAIVNFGLFAAIAVSIGGDALNGTVRNSHYYLAQHGTYTEVSRAVFLYSAVHALSVFLTMAIAAVIGVMARFRARD